MNTTQFKKPQQELKALTNFELVIWFSNNIIIMPIIPASDFEEAKALAFKRYSSSRTILKIEPYIKGRTINFQPVIKDTKNDEKDLFFSKLICMIEKYLLLYTKLNYNNHLVIVDKLTNVELSTLKKDIYIKKYMELNSINELHLINTDEFRKFCLEESFKCKAS